MPDLIDVGDYNPFNVNLVPVEGNPFALKGDVGAAIQQQNATEAAQRNTISNLFHSTVGAPGTVAQPVVPQTPGMWSDEDEARRQATEAAAANWAPQQALNSIGSGLPMAERFGLGMAGGGIKAYHGSPHDFERFDLSKIGTGEGAQAYGHGLYFAENEGTAKSYRDTLAHESYKIDGVPFDMFTTNTNAQPGNYAANALSRMKDDFPNDPAGQKWAAISWLREGGSPHELAAAKMLVRAKSIEPHAGRMYEVNINADPEHFLDWDKPLSEQHPKVKEALTRYGIKGDATDLGEFAGQKVQGVPRTGAEIYQQISQFDPHVNVAKAVIAAGRDPAEPVASEKLREAGIPGIKYLDQGSRITGDAAKIIQNYGSREKALEVAQQRLKSASTGDLRYWDGIVNQLKTPQTNNYVVFNDKLIDIIKKYGLAGLVAGGASHFTTTPIDHNPFAAQQ